MLSYGGISVINAVASLKGASMAINIGVTEVKIEKSEEISEKEPLLRTIISYFVEKYNLEPFRVKVTSNIPQRSGLKSSSAVANAVIYTIAKEFKIEGIDIPLLSAILSKRAGVSITGAFDDASASFYGGIIFTDNRVNKIKKIFHVRDDIKVIIIPGHRPKDINPLKLRKFKNIFYEIWNMGLKGDIFQSMKLNGILVADILGYDLSKFNNSIRKNAIAYGISGNGPSAFIVVKKGEEGYFLDMLKDRNVIVTEVIDLDCERLPVSYKRYC